VDGSSNAPMVDVDACSEREVKESRAVRVFHEYYAMKRPG